VTKRGSGDKRISADSRPGGKRESSEGKRAVVYKKGPVYRVYDPSILLVKGAEQEIPRPYKKRGRCCVVKRSWRTYPASARERKKKKKRKPLYEKNRS